MIDDLDQILSEQDEIVPSSGFVSSVMHAVRDEAAAPEPIRFPWMRAVPVFVAFAVMLVIIAVGIVELIHQPATAATKWPQSLSMEAVQHALVQTNAGWIAFALLLTLLSTLLTFHLARAKQE